MLAGCAGDDSVARDTEEQVRRPTEGGVLRLLYEAPRSLDPTDVESVYDGLPVGQLFDGLVATDASLNVVPALAATWTISRDGRTYTFKLRRGVRFHDGTTVTAEDVVYAFHRVLAPEHRGLGIASSYLSVVEGATAFTERKATDIAGVRALDPETVEIRLTKPYLSFLEVLALDELRVVPAHVHRGVGDAAFDQAPIGSGPFRFASWTQDRLRLVANPDYFGGKPHLDSLEIVFVGPAGSERAVDRYARGEVDALEPSFDQVERLGSLPGSTLYHYQELSLSFLGLSTGIPQFEDRRVRQAIAHAVDRGAQADFSAVARRRADGILPPGLTGYSPTPRALAYDPEEAKRLLAEAGHPGGRGLKPIPLYYSAGSQATARSVARIRQDLEAAGFQVDVREVPWSEIAKRTTEHTAPAFVLGWIADLADPDAFLRTLFEPGGSANYFDFLDRESATLLERGAAELNPVERARIYGELERRILEQAPLVPLFHGVGVIAHRANVHGLKPGPLGLAALNFERVWIDRPEASR